jgi:hypothetical protein
MYNEELLNKVIDKFGIERAKEFCEVTSMLYDIKYTACKTQDCLTEYDFEREWWLNAYNKLNKDIKI